MIKDLLRFLLLVVGNERGELDITSTKDPEGNGGGDPNPDPNGGGDPEPSPEPGNKEPSGGGDPNTELPEGFPTDLDEDIRNDPSLKVFVDKDNKFHLKNLVKSYVHAQKKIGEKGVQLPDENASPEEWKNFYNKIRTPELDKYEVQNKEFEKFKMGDEKFNEFKQLAHENGLTKAQAQAIIDWNNSSSADMNKNQLENYQAEYKKEVDKLKEDWGEGFEQNFNLSSRALKEFADEDTLKYMKKSGLAGNVKLIKLFNKIGKSLMTEDKFEKEAHSSFGMTKEDAQNKIAELQSDPNGAYWNANHMSHKNVVEQVQKLMKVAYGS